MFSTVEPSWGCRCCNGGAANSIAKPEWDIYSVNGVSDSSFMDVAKGAFDIKQ
jgi:hypothetical protein